MFGQKLIYLNESGNLVHGPERIDIDNDSVKVVSAYPNAQRAQVSVIASGCVGTSSLCFVNYYLAYLMNGTLYVHEVNTNASALKITGEYGRGNLTSAVATNVTETNQYGDTMTNQYGDPILGMRSLINGKGFVKSTFKKKYLALVGVHPGDYFSNKVLRENLAKQIGFENFTVLRSYMHVATMSKIIDGQYIVMSGIAKHSGGNQNGVVIVDAVNENYWALWVDEDSNKIGKGATAPWTEKIRGLIDSRR